MKHIETSGWCISDNGELFTDGYYSREEACRMAVEALKGEK